MAKRDYIPNNYSNWPADAPSLVNHKRPSSVVKPDVSALFKRAFAEDEKLALYILRQAHFDGGDNLDLVEELIIRRLAPIGTNRRRDDIRDIDKLFNKNVL